MPFDPSPENADSSSNPSVVLTTLGKHRRLRGLGRFEELLGHFSPAERLLLYALTILLTLSALALLIGASRAISTLVPAEGGTLTEGEIAPVRFINPILALSQADRDISGLVYSGLMRAQPDGSYVPDLAASYSVSPDGTTYTFTLRPDATFQDGTKVTSADVAYTISLAQNPEIKSPLQANWDGVKVSTPDDKTIVFTLPHPYAPFLEDATLGILPKHLWQNVSAEEFPFSSLNTHPIGSGPYKISRVTTDSTDSATRYDLTPFKNFALGSGLLRTISFAIFPNADAEIAAFNQGKIDALAGLSPDQISSLTRKGDTLLSTPLPRVYGVFLNQNHAAVLQDASVRAALDAAVDKQRLVDSVLKGYGVPLTGPIPPGVLGDSPTTVAQALPVSIASSTSDIVNTTNIDTAHDILVKGGWKFTPTTASSSDATSTGASGSWTKGKQTLAFSLATADDPELVATAHALARDWQALGVNVSVEVYPLSQFNTSVLRPRQYDAILFGEVIGRSLDLFAFWHSSQRNDPGLNLAMYTSSKSDQLLSDARGTTDTNQRNSLYEEFASQVQKDQPAIFLFAPDFLYALPADIHGVTLGALTDPSERFLNAYQWYTETQYVWNFLLKSGK